MHTDTAQGFAANEQNANSSATEDSASDSAPSDVSREYQHFVADIEDLLQSTTSLTGAALAQAKTKLYTRIAVAKQSVQKLGSALSDYTTDAAKGVDSDVHEQPWKAIGIAIGVSLAVGYLLGRRE